MIAAMLALLIASPTPSPSTVSPPTPTPVIVWVKAYGTEEVVRIAFLGFDVDHPPRAPGTLTGSLSGLGRSSRVTMYRRWQGAGAAPGGWVPADYVLKVPRGVGGDVVLSLRTDRQGWAFRVSQKQPKER